MMEICLLLIEWQGKSAKDGVGQFAVVDREAAAVADIVSGALHSLFDNDN